MKLQKNEKKQPFNLFEALNNEIKHIEKCESSGGVLLLLEELLEKIRTFPLVNHVLFQVENEVARENQKILERHEKTVKWFHNIFQLLLPYLPHEGGGADAIRDLLDFRYYVFGGGGYINSLLFNLRKASSLTLKYGGTALLFEGWAELERLPNGDLCIGQFIFPDYVQEEISKPQMEEQLHQWVEKADTSLVTLLPFMKILSQYSSSKPLVYGETSSKSYFEYHVIENQMHIGNYLQMFRNPDRSKHPLSIEELKRLLEKFICMLQKELSAPVLKGPAKKRVMSQAAENYCVSRLVEHISFLSEEELAIWKKYSYSNQVFKFLVEEAGKTNQPFIDQISQTMVKERAGPEANRRLLDEFNIVWRKIPTK